MATAEEVARELETLLQTLQESNEKAQRGLAFDWEKELNNKLIKKFLEAGDTENEAKIKAASVTEGFTKTMGNLGTATAKYVQTIGATVDMLNRQSTALNAVNDVMRKQVETTNALIDAGAQFAKDMVTMFLPGGPIVKFITSAAIGIGTFLLKQKNELDNKLNNAARDMAEKQYKIYSDLGQAGAMAVGGMDDVARLGAKFNLTTEQMGPLVNAIKDSGKELAQLGGSVSGGIKIMEQLGSVTKDNEMQLRHMGISMEQVPEYASSYMKILKTTGVTQERATKLGSEAMMEYIRETNALTALTGATRREQEEAAEAIYQQKATAAALLLMPEEQRKSYQEFSKMMVGLDKGFAPVVQGLTALATGTLNSADSVKLMEQLEPALNAAGTSSQKFTEAIKNAKSDVERQKLGTELIAALNNPKIQEEILATQAISAEFGLDVAVTRAAQERKGLDIAKELQKIEQDRIDKEKGKDAATQEAAKTQKTLQDANMEYAKFMQSQMPAALKDGRAAIEKFGTAAEYVANKIYKDFGLKAPEAPKKSVEKAAAESAVAAKTAADAYQKAQAPGATAEDKAAYQKAAAESQKAAVEEREALLQKQKVERELRLDAKKLAQLEKQQAELEKEGRTVTKNAVTARIQELQTQMAEKKKSVAGTTPAAPGAPGTPGIGSLSAQYESGRKGSAAVGFDSTGGASYGKYQIATKTGTMDRFLSFLDKADAESAKRLRAAGPAGERGGGFEQEWQKLVAEGKIQGAEHEFIKQTHYDEALSKVNKNLSDMIVGSKALQEVMWSTSVQHGAGGAARLFNKSFRSGMNEAELIKAVYDARATQFSKSTPQERQSVQARFQDEQARAMAMIGQPASAAGGTILSGPTTGYQPNLTMHGTEAIIPLDNSQVPVEIKLDSSLGQTLVTLKDVLMALVEGQQVSAEILERIEAASRNTAAASEKTARYAGS